MFMGKQKIKKTKNYRKFIQKTLFGHAGKKF